MFLRCPGRLGGVIWLVRGLLSNPTTMSRCELLALVVLGSVVGLPSPGALRGGRADGSPVSVSTSCSQEVLFGKLVVTNASVGAFVLQGGDVQFLAPPGVDVTAFDGVLVRIDFDEACSVRTILRAERLEGPVIEA